MSKDQKNTLVDSQIEQIITRLIYGEPEKLDHSEKLASGGQFFLTECGIFTFEVRATVPGKYFVLVYSRQTRDMAMTVEVRVRPPRASEKWGLDLTTVFSTETIGEEICNAYVNSGFTHLGDPHKRLGTAFRKFTMGSDRFDEFFHKRVPITLNHPKGLFVTLSEETTERLSLTFKSPTGRVVGYLSCEWDGTRMNVHDHPYLCSISDMEIFLNSFTKQELHN